MALKLFEDDDDSSQNEDISKIEIDEDYARRLEYNRKRQDLQRYEELKKRGVINEDSEESDESEESEFDEEFGDSIRDLKFFDSLIKVKKQDPSLKNKDVKLFESDESDDDGEDGGSEKDENDGNDETDKKNEKKKMYLKDVQAKHLIEEGPEFDEEDSDVGVKGTKKIMTYAEEQEELRKALLEAVEAAEAEADEDDEDLLKVKENNREDFEEDEEFVKKVDEYFGGDAELDDNKKFLKEYFTKQLWKDRDEKGERAMLDVAELDELEEDEDELERQEEYETNYRYEENAGDRIMGHSRKVEESVRKKETARKVQRKSKEERMRIAELERQEELKHLKNLKKKEIKERMKKVFAVAGFKEGEECPFNTKDLDDEFDPDEYDRMMKAVFDEKYYDAEDSGFGSDEDDEKPDFDKEDELLGLPKNWDVIKPGDGFLAAREKSLKHKVDGDGNGDEDVAGGAEEEDGSDEDEEKEEEEQKEETEESKRKRKRKASLVQRAKEALMEDYYKLDYEDTIGDLKTRFKYAKVKPNRYGLSSEEILGLDDKELSQYVSLKKITTYREKEWKVPNSKRHQQKLKNKELLWKKHEHHKNDKKKHKKRPRDDDDKKKATSDDRRTSKKKKNIDEADKSALVTDNIPEAEDDTSNLSRKAKRRRRQSELKLSRSRMVAYGKV